MKHLFLILMNFFILSSYNGQYQPQDYLPEFPGGDERFRKIVAKKFNQKAVNGSGVFNTTIKFVVEPNGNVSEVMAQGDNESFNEEAIRVVRSIKGWKAGTLKGEKVRSYFAIPLRIYIEPKQK